MADAHKQTLKRVLHKIASERGYETYQLEANPISTGGANYSSLLFNGKITTPNEELNFFAKVAACGEKFREQMPTNLFTTERYAYTTLADIFTKIQDEHSVPEEDRLLMPELYGYDGTDYEEVIVMQDLGPQGFKLYDRLVSMDWAYAASAIRQLAIFHSLSVAMRLNHPEKYEEVAKILVCKKFDNDSAMVETVGHGIKRSIEMTREENRERLGKCLEEFMPKMMEEFYGYDRLPVLVHGDFRMSNTMYKINEDGEHRVMILDYQTLHIGTSAKDLMYFIFTGSDGEFRKHHYTQLLDLYYQQLTLALSRLDLDPEKIYPREDFDYEIKKNHLLGLLFAVFSLPVVTVEEENAPKVDGSLEVDTILHVEASQTCRKRLNEIVDDYIEWGVL